MLDTRGKRERHLAEREAIFTTLERFGLVTRTRGGTRNPASERKDFPDHYNHDPNGNLTSDGVRDFFYDYRNNLVKVEQDSSVVAEYEFDALGRRTKKTVGAAVTKFFYDGEHCVQEFSGANALLRTFVYGQEIDEIRLMIAPDVADVDGDQDTYEVLNFYYHHKSLGTVSHITGPDESVVEQYDYLPYGRTTIKDGQGNDLSGQSAIGSPYMFTARRFDEETGLYHYRRRAYDPETGRFLQRDPLGYLDSSNLYTYCLADPLAFTDPFGEEPGCLVVGGVVILEYIVVRVGVTQYTKHKHASMLQENLNELRAARAFWAQRLLDPKLQNVAAKQINELDKSIAGVQRAMLGDRGN